ncbi:MAG: hypothetical protein EOM14_13460 [Clostridia bacterium]|nr:hypothetical protein [Clostridia bacterium]
MQSVLEEFALGNLSPEPRSFKRGSQYGRTMQTLADSEAQLLAALGGAEKKTFEKLIDTQAEISLLSGVDKFIYGYRLGVLMTMEVFEGKENLIADGEVC